jgi:hypothetical protein
MDSDAVYYASVALLFFSFSVIIAKFHHYERILRKRTGNKKRAPLLQYLAEEYLDEPAEK